MPINPNIALAVQPPQANDLLGNIGKVMSLRDLMQQGKLREIQARQAETQLAENEKFKEAVGRGAPFVELASISPGLAIEWVRAQSDAKKADIDLEAQRLELASSRVRQLGQMAASILQADPHLRPQLYASVIKQATERGFIPPEHAQQLPQQYDQNTEAMLAQFQDQAMSFAERTQVARVALDRLIEENRNKRENEKIENQKRRTAAYEESIAGLNNKRVADIQRLAMDLERRIERDADLDETTRERLRIYLKSVTGNLEARQAEETGRNERTRMVQDRTDARQQRYIDKGINPLVVAQQFQNAQKAAVNMPGFEDMEPDEKYELINGLFVSFMNQLTPQVSGAEGKGGFFTSPTIPRVTPGATVKRPPLSPQAQPEANQVITPQPAAVPPPQPAGQKIRVRRLSDGKTGTINAEDFDPKLYEKISG